MIKRWQLLFCVSAASFLACPTYPSGTIPDYDFDWLVIGDPGNAAYDGGPFGQLAGRGSVNYQYRMSQLEVSSAQWLEFINIFAPQSDNPLFFGLAAHSGIRPGFGGGTYELDPEIENAGMVPVGGITWWEAAMYVNWLHNDKPTEWEAIMSGAYDASTFGRNPDGTLTDQLTHSPDARFWIPTLDEWIKAAHYDPNRYGAGQGGWWLYSHNSDDPPIPGPPGEGETSAGQFENPIPLWHIPVGSYPGVQSPWGLLDLSGAASEWLEEVNDYGNGPRERLFDGEWAGSRIFQENRDEVYVTDIAHPASHFTMGLRVASAVSCRSDINGDGVIEVMDLRDLLDCFGQPAFPGCGSEDVNDDGTVDVLDLIELLLELGKMCP